MKSISIFATILLIGLSTFAEVNNNASAGGGSCNNTVFGGVDIWPWSVAQPFPWDNIEGYWKLGDDQLSFLNVRVLSSTNNRRILSLSIHSNGICSKPSAKGTGYIDITDKNVVRALILDGVYKYQLKLGMFDSRDVFLNDCSSNIMGLSIQVIARARKAGVPAPDVAAPLDPSVTEIRNLVLKKVAAGADKVCKKIN